MGHWSFRPCDAWSAASNLERMREKNGSKQHYPVSTYVNNRGAWAQGIDRRNRLRTGNFPCLKSFVRSTGRLGHLDLFSIFEIRSFYLSESSKKRSTGLRGSADFACRDKDPVNSNDSIDLRLGVQFAIVVPYGDPGCEHGPAEPCRHPERNNDFFTPATGIQVVSSRQSAAIAVFSHR